MPATVDVTTPSEREIKVTRVFDAPARLVFDFHTKAEHVQKWLLGPPVWSMPVCEIDLRVGGRYHYVWRNAGNGAEFGARGEYREIAAPTRIVHSESMDGAEGEALCTLTFVESGGRTTLSTTMLFSSKEARDQALQSGMTDGMSMSYDRLEAVMNEKVR
ncbi:Uncharacterized conserved protein YndB, AHSA1/START domain [Rhizobiales bacterium GAS113]|nr:Uncharacterized conserved protein YndB, AHSA1/START domain [Rhizobiales bacterium GAS113]